MGGIHQPKMMKFRGSVHGKDGVIWNSGTRQMQLLTTSTPSFKVKLGDGCWIPFEGIRKGLELDAEDCNTETDYYVLPLGIA